MKNKIRRLLNKLFNIDVVRYENSKLIKLLHKNEVDMIFDIGANNGGSGKYFRSMGYKGKIISFEPISQLYNTLLRTSMADPLWSARQIALGDKNEKSVINITGGHGGPSSILEMTEILKQSAPTEKVVRQEEIEVRKLEDVIRECYDGRKLFCKIDTQGYEKKILDGAGSELDKIVGLKVEMSIKPQYHGESLYNEMIEYLSSKGFSLISIENGWADPVSDELYQIDGIFFRTNQ